MTDAINGFLRVLLSEIPGYTYNIGNPSPGISMKDLVKGNSKALGNKPLEFDTVDYPSTYPADESNRPALTSLRQLLNLDMHLELVWMRT